MLKFVYMLILFPTTQAFFAKIHEEVEACRPGISHNLLKELINNGRVYRHYTMNIDGYSQNNTFPIHGNIHSVFCPLCGVEQNFTKEIRTKMKTKKLVQCQDCLKGVLRSKIVLYNDEESEHITSERKLWSTMENDLKEVEFVLWIGISFLQATSMEYFQKTWNLNQKVGHVIINPDDSVEFNLRSGLFKQNVEFVYISMESAKFLKAFMNAL
eukprot:g3264.t1